MARDLRLTDMAVLGRNSRNVYGFPTGFLVYKPFQQGMVKRVSRFMRHDVTDKGHSEQRKVANTVQHLVADKLVFIAKSFLIQYLVLVDDHGIVERAPSGKSVFL